VVNVADPAVVVPGGGLVVVGPVVVVLVVVFVVLIGIVVIAEVGSPSSVPLASSSSPMLGPQLRLSAATIAIEIEPDCRFGDRTTEQPTTDSIAKSVLLLS